MPSNGLQATRRARLNNNLFMGYILYQQFWILSFIQRIPIYLGLCDPSTRPCRVLLHFIKNHENVIEPLSKKEFRGPSPC